MQAGSMVFCAPFNTSSNLTNILPVIRMAQEKDILGGIIYDRVDPKTLRSEFPDVQLLSSADMLRFVPAISRVTSLFKGILCIARLERELRDALPPLSGGLRRNCWRWVGEIARAMRFNAAFRELFRKSPPSILLSTSDYFPFDSQFFEAGKALSIPGGVVQHGITDDFWWPFTADYLFLWGECACQEMTALGAPASRLIACGMVASDSLFAQAKGNERSARLEGGARVLLLSQAQDCKQQPELYERFARVLPQIVAETPWARWRVKLHPAEDGSFYRAFSAGGARALEILPKETTLAGALEEADVVVTLYSTAGLEAMICDKPLVVLDIHPTVGKYAWWPAAGGGLRCSTVAEATSEIAALSGDRHYLNKRLEGQREFLARYFANQGKAAEAVFNSAQRIASLRHPDPPVA